MRVSCCGLASDPTVVSSSSENVTHRVEMLRDPVRGARRSRLALLPQMFIRLMRTGADGVERVAFIGYVNQAQHDAGTKISTLNLRAPESLILESFAPPFPIPLAEHVTAPQVFEFWWKQLGYVFALPNPRSFPPLPDVLGDEERAVVERYEQVTARLAGSGVLNALSEGFNIRQPEGPRGPEEITQNFSRADLQAGFAVFLRQCDSTDARERASFHRVRGILDRAAAATSDEFRGERLAQLKAWRSAAGRLHTKSLNQLIRDKLVAEERLRAFAYDEEHTPSELLPIYDYGDLIHWDSERSPELAAFEQDPFTASDRRLAFLDAASGLAHLYIGFAELARAAIGRVIAA
jgi:hypothetical protein